MPFICGQKTMNRRKFPNGTTTIAKQTNRNHRVRNLGPFPGVFSWKEIGGPAAPIRFGIQ
jgi:hypothetical protein